MRRNRPRYNNAPRQLIDEALQQSNANPNKRGLCGTAAPRSVVDAAQKGQATHGD
jgi:hypothetical protein